MVDSLHLEHLGAHRTAFDHVPEACGRVLLLGEDNPQSSDPRHALYPLPAGCAGSRLQDRILDVGMAPYLATWRTNLCSPRWSLSQARLRARALISRAAPWDIIIALGAKVAHVMGELTTVGTRYPKWTPFTVRTAVNDGVNQDVPTPLLRVVYLPHPSGRNLVWNSGDAVSTARHLIREVVPGYPAGES